MRYRHIAPALLAMAAVLYGCGGSSPSITSATAPKITISWPAQTRDFSAPEQANHAVISLTIPQVNQYGQPTVLTWQVSRPAGSAASTNTYTGPVLPSSGPATVNVSFYYKETPTTTLTTPMAQAQVPAYVSPDGTLTQSDGTALGTVTYGAVPTALTIAVTPAEMRVGDTALLTASGVVSGYGLVALPQKYVDFSVTNGTGNAALSSATLTALAAGTVSVRATSGSLTASTTLTVQPALIVPHKLSLKPNQMAWDPTRGVFWGTLGTTGVPANSLISFSPTTGAISSTIGGLPGANSLALSANGSVAYVGCDGVYGIKKVTVATSTVGSTMGFLRFGQPITATGLTINPADSNEFCAQGDYVSPSLFQGGSQILNGSSGSANRMLYTAPNRLVTVNGSRAEIYEVGPAMLNFLAYVDTPGNGYGGDAEMVGTKLFTSGGQVVDPATQSIAGNLSPFPNASGYGMFIATDAAMQRAWYLLVGYYSAQIRVFNTTTYAMIGESSVVLPNSSDAQVKNFGRYGTSGLFIHATDGIHLIPSAPGL